MIEYGGVFVLCAQELEDGIRAEGHRVGIAAGRCDAVRYRGGKPVSRPWGERSPAAPGYGRESKTLGSEKRRYVPPALERYGDLRTFILGGSPGAGDSGAMFTENPFP